MPRTFIIAEAGVNHNGRLDLALALVRAAAAAGADAVKFQTFVPEQLVVAQAPTARYQQKNAGQSNQLQLLQSLTLSEEALVQCQALAQTLSLEFLSTPFDLPSLALLERLNVARYKVSSGDFDNYPLLEALVRTGKPLILSTGMSDEAEVGQVMEVLVALGMDFSHLTLLLATSAYPTPMEDVNLKSMLSLQSYVAKVGLSDHSQGWHVPVAAVALGASVIEKHLTLSHHLPGPDHVASLEVNGFTQMVQAIRRTEVALGSTKKCVGISEQDTRQVARKSLVARCAIQAGDVFTASNVTTKRPATGMSPLLWPQLMGRSANRSYAKDALIEEAIDQKTCD